MTYQDIYIKSFKTGVRISEGGEEEEMGEGKNEDDAYWEFLSVMSVD